MSGKAFFCGNCGAKLEQDHQFCGNCGQAVDHIVPSAINEMGSGLATDQQAAAEKPVEGKKPEKPHINIKMIAIGLAVLLALGFGAWGSYKWIQSRSGEIALVNQLPQTGPPPESQFTTKHRPKTEQGMSNQSGRIVSGWIGLNIQDVPWDVAGRIGMATPSGALVVGCEPGGPAERAGLLPGDVLLQMNGVQLVSANDLRERVAGESPGRIIQFTVWRNGIAYQASVLSVEKPANFDRQKRSEANSYASAYAACFAKFCPGCNNPLDLFQEQTPDCRQCEAFNQEQLNYCATGGRP